jgi:hypothetical protein
MAVGLGSAGAVDLEIPRDRNLNLSTNISATGSQLSFDGFKYQARCDIAPAPFGYTAVSHLFVSGPEGTLVSAYGIAQDTFGATTGPVASATTTRAPADFLDLLNVGRTNSGASRTINPMRVVASNGSSQLVFLHTTLNAGPLPAGQRRCAVEATITSTAVPAP